jgi:hypothetical protein
MARRPRRQPAFAGPAPARVAAPPPALRRLAAGALAALTFACGAGQEGAGHGFWLRAADPPRLTLLPPPPLSAPGVAVQHDVAGRVVALRGPISDGMRELELLPQRGRSEERVVLRYQLGRAKALPVEVGETVALRLLVRRHVEDDGEDMALLLWRVDASASRLGRAALAERRTLLAAVEQRGLLARQGLPRGLAAITATPIAVYFAAGRLGRECEETHQQSWFRVGSGGWVRQLVGHRNARDPRLLAPGSSFLLDDGADPFEVALHDNRRTMTSACRIASESTWSWTAVAPPVSARRPVPGASASPSPGEAAPGGPAGAAAPSTRGP